MKITPKIKKILTYSLVILAFVIGCLAIIFSLDFTPQSPTKWGVTFSPYYAEQELGLDWQETYLAILDELKVDHLRLSAYWNYIQPTPDSYDFTALDWQIQEATKRDAKIILAVGRKLPRWPECHDPVWLEMYSAGQIRQQEIKYIETTVRRYMDNPNIIAWQIENEPYLSTFGDCPPLDRKHFLYEVNLVKHLSDKPILITDSGELNMWWSAANSGGDWVGTTLYRVVYNPYIGYLRYFYPPAFYAGKAWLIQTMYGTERVIAAEVQAEAWHTEVAHLGEMSLADQLKSVDINQFKRTLDFTRRAGFDEAYLWGVEWWYFLKHRYGYDNFWETAKTLW